MMQHFFKRLTPAAALAVGLGLSGCNMNITVGGDGVPLSELDMTGAAPNAIALAAPDKVIITEGDSLDITVEGDADAAEALRFDLDGSDLAIYREDGWDNNGSNTIRITMLAPREIDVAGSGNIETAVIDDDAEINIAGSGEVTVERVAATRLEVNIGGSGEATAAGAAESLEVNIGGSGDVNFGELTADDVEISIGGSGDVTLASDGTVEASIAGSGDVNVTGNAKCTVSAMGSGTLNCSPRAEPPEATEETPQDEAGES